MNRAQEPVAVATVLTVATIRPLTTRWSLRSDVGWMALACGLLLVIALLPLLAVHHPPLQDYPNHLARMHILAHPEAPFLRDYWAPNWVILPNLAMDLTVPWLLQWMSLAAAGKLFVASTLVLMFLGTVAINVALYRQPTLLPLLAVIFLPNLALQKGFLNYLFSIALSLWAYAGWIVIARRPAGVRIAYIALLSPVLYLCHLHGLATFIIAVLVTEAVGWEVQLPFKLFAGASRVSVALAGFLPILLFHATTSQLSTSGQAWVFATLKTKLLVGRFLVPLFDERLDIALTLALAALLILGLRSRWLSIPKPIAVLLLVLVSLYAVLPDEAFTGANVDWRLWVPLVFLGLGGATLRREPRLSTPLGVSILAAVMVLAILRFAQLQSVWVAADRDYLQLRRVTAHLPIGARLFSVVRNIPYDSASSQGALLHLPAYAVIDRSAFVPSLFASPVQQPLKIRPVMSGAINDGASDTYYGFERAIDCSAVNKAYDYALVMQGGEMDSKSTCAWPLVYRTETMYLLKVGALVPQ